MASTRLFIALMAAVVLFVGVVADRRDEEFAAAWLFVIGMALATLWSVLGFGLAKNHQTALSAREYLLVTSMTVLLTIFYLYRARDITRVAKRQ